MPLVATKLIPGHALSRYKPYQTKPNHNKKYQTPTKKAYQNKPHHTMQNQTEPKKKKNTKTNWVVLVKVLFAIFCSKSVNKNLIP